jgi:ATP-dependent DNA helicase PIF1
MMDVHEACAALGLPQPHTIRWMRAAGAGGRAGRVVVYPTVRFTNGREELVTPEEVTKELSGTGAASMVQVPLKAAWAITMHKSQGMSIEYLTIEASGVFERGQFYVALSRARDPNKTLLQLNGAGGGGAPAARRGQLDEVVRRIKFDPRVRFLHQLVDAQAAAAAAAAAGGGAAAAAGVGGGAAAAAAAGSGAMAAAAAGGGAAAAAAAAAGARGGGSAAAAAAAVAGGAAAAPAVQAPHAALMAPPAADVLFASVIV